MQISRTAILFLGTLTTLPALASEQWVNWSSTSDPTYNSSTITISGNVDGVNVNTTGDNGSILNAQLNENPSSPNYWTDSNAVNANTYNNSLVTGPTSSDIIQLGNSGTETITFSQAVVDPLIALVSWNQDSNASTTFSAPFQILSGATNGCNNWGCGSFQVTSPTSFWGNGETNGVIEFQGTYTSISFTDNFPENWHGFTVGFESIASVTSVPEPETFTMFTIGLLGLGLARRKSIEA
ncbi:MAG: PEP-CTERM sorting domain-containing protein [Methylomonas sp.]|jgi:hypothetical protein